MCKRKRVRERVRERISFCFKRGDSAHERAESGLIVRREREGSWRVMGEEGV